MITETENMSVINDDYYFDITAVQDLEMLSSELSELRQTGSLSTVVQQLPT